MPFRRTSIDSNQRTGFYSPKRSRVVGSRVVGYDSDALVYINAVEAADGQALEGSVKDAYNTFVVGCKSDGIWNAIKASCIMAGARTLSGALVPLVGVAPSGFNLASGTYSRVTGLKGDGAAMYLSSNRDNNADPQNNNHNAVYITQAHTLAAGGRILSNGAASNGTNSLIVSDGSSSNFVRNRSATSAATTLSVPVLALYGVSRAASGSITVRVNSISSGISLVSQLPLSGALTVYQGAGSSYSNARIAFYSIGESLDLALLDTRVSGLMVAISGAIS